MKFDLPPPILQRLTQLRASVYRERATTQSSLGDRVQRVRTLLHRKFMDAVLRLASSEERESRERVDPIDYHREAQFDAELIDLIRSEFGAPSSRTHYRHHQFQVSMFGMFLRAIARQQNLYSENKAVRLATQLRDDIAAAGITDARKMEILRHYESQFAARISDLAIERTARTISQRTNSGTSFQITLEERVSEFSRSKEVRRLMDLNALRARGALFQQGESDARELEIVLLSQIDELEQEFLDKIRLDAEQVDVDLDAAVRRDASLLVEFEDLLCEPPPTWFLARKRSLQTSLRDWWEGPGEASVGAASLAASSVGLAIWAISEQSVAELACSAFLFVCAVASAMAASRAYRERKALRKLHARMQQDIQNNNGVVPTLATPKRGSLAHDERV